MERALRVGVVGLGRMGLPICERLAGAGHDVVATDLRAELRRPAAAAGARWTASAAELAAAVDVAITVLPGHAEVAAVVGALTGSLAPGATWIDMSTASPAAAREIAAAAAARGVRALDAPVGGNPQAAAEGRLLAFVGAEPGDLDAQRPLLAALADRIVHLGPPGSGYLGKLLVNLLWFGQAVATAEALAVARRSGLDLARLLEGLRQSAAASAFLDGGAAALLRGDDLPAFPLARCCEQLAAAVALGDELGVPLDLAAVVAQLHARALERYGDVDGELLGARYVADRAGVSLRPPDAQ
jgi:3-hydroxyisobutyrate dehydrogenase